ncbi:MAG TPA: ATP-binding protein [Actinocrinis sp.]|nr:ATP-binding protein [Actinocrinis sp.]
MTTTQTTPDPAPGYLIEFGGLPGTGKSTLAQHLAARTGAVLLRIDEIESALRRNGLTPAQTGLAAYSVAHDLAASHLKRGMTVIADAVNPVEEARAGWRDLARECGARHAIIEACCPDPAEHRRRVENRTAGRTATQTGAHADAEPQPEAPDRVAPAADDLPGWVYPTWPEVCLRAGEYQPRTDDRLVVDTTAPLDDSHREVARYLGL